MEKYTILEGKCQKQIIENSFDPRNREVWDVNWRDTGTNSNLVVPKNYESVGF